MEVWTMTTRTTIRTDRHDNGHLSRTVERVEHDNGLTDQHEAFFSRSGVRHNFLVSPYYTDYAFNRRNTRVEGN
jgi:hypothetical protein